MARTVTLTLPEEVDIYNVAITEYSITEGSEIVDNVHASAETVRTDTSMVCTYMVQVCARP